MPRRPYAGGGGRATWSRFLGGGYAGDALQIIGDVNLVPGGEQALDAVRDASADLDDQPATGFQRGVRLRDQALDYFESCRSCENRLAGFEFAHFELHLVCFGFADVRWIRYDEIECEGIETLEQIGLLEVNSAFELMAGGIGMRDFECGRGDVGGMDLCLWKFLGQGQGDAARSGAYVDDANWAAGRGRPASVV